MALLALGLVASLAAILGRNIGGIHIAAAARGLLLAIGVAMMALAVNVPAGSRIRLRLSANRKKYMRAATASAFLLTGAVVLVAYAYFASLGTWANWRPTTDYYDRLARAFRAGHLYVAEAPSPALIALPNPYDPEARQGLLGTDPQVPGSIWDMSLYHGRVYLYWGPAPALMLLALKTFFPVTLGDQYLTFIFLLGAFIFQSLLLIRIWRRFFYDVPAWTVIVGLLFAGLANPIPWLLFLPRIYEAAIAAGQFFLMVGLYFAFRALDRPNGSSWRLALAAVAWVCAVGSRATLAIAVLFLGLAVVAWLVWRPRRAAGPQAAILPVVAFAVPLVLGATLLAWYNFARFGSAFEFGFRYAITMLDQNKYHDVLFSPVYLGPNLDVYLLNRPELTNVFPFVKPVWNGDLVTAFNTRFQSIYQSERTIGVIYGAPFLLFGLIPLGYAAWNYLRGRQSLPSDVLRPAENDPFFRPVLLAISGLALLQLLVTLLVYYATMRYLLDAFPAWAILSMLGFWLGYHSLVNKPFWRLSYSLLAVLLALISIVMAVLIGFSADVPRLKAANPSLIPHLRLFFMALARQLGR